MVVSPNKATTDSSWLAEDSILECLNCKRPATGRAITGPFNTVGKSSQTLISQDTRLTSKSGPRFRVPLDRRLLETLAEPGVESNPSIFVARQSHRPARTDFVFQPVRPWVLICEEQSGRLRRRETRAWS